MSKLSWIKDLASLNTGFTNSWLSDDADLKDEESLGLVDITAKVNRDIGLKLLGLVGTIIIFSFILGRMLKSKKVKNN